MTWSVLEVLMVVLERGVGVEEKGMGGWGVTSVGWWWWGLEGEERGKEGGGVGWGVRLLLLDC